MVIRLKLFTAPGFHSQAQFIRRVDFRS